MADNASYVTTRTPVSVLQELCTIHNLVPDYKVSGEGAPHAPTFTIRVQVNDDVATATGASKKKAKHAAAKLLLQKLLSKDGKFCNGFVSDGITFNSETLPELLVETTKATAPTPEETGEKNAVGLLQEKCVKKQWAMPLYENGKDPEGPPHDRVFQIFCHVEKFETIGSGKSKRLAKRESAEKMLKQLLELKLIEKEEDETSEKAAKLEKNSDLHLNEENTDASENVTCDASIGENKDECQESNKSTELEPPHAVTTTVLNGKIE